MAMRIPNPFSRLLTEYAAMVFCGSKPNCPIRDRSLGPRNGAGLIGNPEVKLSAGHYPRDPVNGDVTSTIVRYRPTTPELQLLAH